MIQYTGKGDQFQVTVILFGDGITNSITIDMSQSPFGIKFVNVPVRVVAFNYAGGSPKIRSIDQVQKNLVIVFEEPLPVTPFSASSPGNIVQTRLDLYFIYETQPVAK